ncbi:MAG: ATP-dependent Clp protease adaptor ClpS [Ignavibacteria bacterium]|nr:ATP-dependent Clp protease adaptor ClpS [Ignavibacteria bacterium]
MTLFQLQNIDNPAELLELDSEIIAETTLQARVILYNDEEHTFDEVIRQIVKATLCPITQAEALTLEVHFRGKAMVFEGSMSQCLRVSAVLEEIALHTQLEF